MKLKNIILGMVLLIGIKAIAQDTNKFIFFLHNRFLETHGLEEEHPLYGKTEYKKIIATFKQNDFIVFSEIREGNINAYRYARNIVKEINNLITAGIAAKNITVVGTSKGGYIAQHVSTLANNPDLNFVFIAAYQDTDIEKIPGINFCGNILTIYEKSDPFGVSAVARKKASTCTITNFKEIELSTGLRHGFLFKPLQEWLQPTMKWANGNYVLD